MWTPNLPEGYEARKCRYRVASLCRGVGIDLSCQDQKIVKNAIGIGKDISLDIYANDALGIFSNDYFDYVFDAHQLGNFACTEAALKEWWRLVKYGGHLILYEQDRDFYPHAGTPGAAAGRQKDLIWQDAWAMLKEFGNAKLISVSRHNDSNEYSWQLIVQKKFSLLRKPFEMLFSRQKAGKVCFPRKKKSSKEAIVIRYGALGDSLWVTPVLSNLKRDDYYVVMNCTEYAAQALRENPNIDEFIIHEEGTDVPYKELDAYWQYIGRSFEKVINLTKSIEGSLVKCEGDPEYNWPHEKRHAECNVNFQDRTMELAGYPEDKGRLPELHFSDTEEHLARVLAEQYKDNFLIVWALTGSAYHKTYPWWEYVAAEIVRNCKEVRIITVGDERSRVLEGTHSAHPHIVNKSGVLTVRQSFLLTKYADLVIGPDTGVLNAASCFDTPKIIFMSANSEENLTKYWNNCTALIPEDCECHPCHRLIYENSCPKGKYAGAPVCMENIKPEAVLTAFERYYLEWKQKEADRCNKLRFAAFTIADSPITHRLAKRVKTSFEHFHPDVPFYVFDVRDEKKILGQVRQSACACKAFEIRPRLLSYLLKDFDGVIYLDADTVVTAPLDEFLAGDYEVAGSLNIDGFGQNFLNAGVHAVRSDSFCREWAELMYRPDSGPSNQVYFNQLAYSGRFRLKIVDSKDVYYNERSRQYWKDIIRTDGHLVCNDRVVKVLHWAGGTGRMEQKLSSKDFRSEVREFLNTITKTTDFTEIEGQEVSKWT